MKTIFGCFILIVVCAFNSALAQNIKIAAAPGSPQTKYAAGMLNKALLKKGASVGKGTADVVVKLVIDSINMEKEAFSIVNDGTTISITGGDGAGLIYGSLSIAEDLRNGIKLQSIKASSEKPHVPFRAIKFDLPWDTYRRSTALDLHVETCKDINYWKAF